MPSVEQLKITITWKQGLKLLSLVAFVVGMYYKLLSDIEVATREPVAEVTRTEYDLKFELVAEKLKTLDAKLNQQDREILRLRNAGEIE